MTDEDAPKLARVDALTYVTGAILAGGVGVTMAAAGGNLNAIEVAANVVLPTAALAAAHGLHRILVPRREKLAQGYVQVFGNDPEKAHHHAEAHKDEPDFQDIMFQMFKNMMSAVDPEVVPTLGYLAGQYTYANRNADLHFRSVGRLLCDLEPGDLKDLKRFLHAAVKSDNPKFNQTGFADVRIDEPQLDEKTRPTLNVGGEDLGFVESAWRLIRLLRREDFGWASQVDDAVKRHTSPDHYLSIGWETARKLLSTIDPAPARG